MAIYLIKTNEPEQKQLTSEWLHGLQSLQKEAERLQKEEGKCSITVQQFESTEGAPGKMTREVSYEYDGQTWDPIALPPELDSKIAAKWVNK